MAEAHLCDMASDKIQRKFRSIVPGTLPTQDFHQFMVGLVAPRPIAFVSTVDANGQSNLAPYSFFNAFSSNPPLVVFSSNRRVSDNSTKDTLATVRATGECVINMVSYDIVQQMAIASIEWPSEVSEFDTSGLSPLPSELVKAPRVAESPAAMECKVREVVTLGEEGGAGHLIICDVLRIHVAEDCIDDRDRIDPHKIDLVGRLGRSYYVRASGDAIFPVVQARLGAAIGYQALPASARNSKVLTGNDLGQLSGCSSVPDPASVEELKSKDARVREIIAHHLHPREELHRLVQEALQAQQPDYALKICMVAEGLDQ